MPWVFHPLFNTVAKASIFGAVLLIGGGVWVASAIERSPYVTDAGVFRQQPVPFSHEHHVGGLGRYCHTTVETSPVASVPPTHTCMTCHSQLYTQTAMLAPVRESLAENKPIHWNKVNRRFTQGKISMDESFRPSA
jgi:hypothetical protein